MEKEPLDPAHRYIRQPKKHANFQRISLCIAATLFLTLLLYPNSHSPSLFFSLMKSLFGNPCNPANIQDFLNHLDFTLTRALSTSQLAQWNYATNITDTNLEISTAALLMYNDQVIQYKQQAKSMNLHCASSSQKRQMDLLTKHTASVPKCPKQQKELADLIGTMEGIYGSAKVNGEPLEPTLTNKMATLRDYDQLKTIYIGWRNSTGPKMRQAYTRYVELSNKAAQENGFSSIADEWLSQYEMNSKEMQDLIEDAFDQIQPIYQELHCHVRRRLESVYGSQHFGKDNLIPGHLLGNMWAQTWGNIADLVVPYPNEPTVNVTKSLKLQNYTAERMHQLSESFYTNLGFSNLPKTFWTQSMLTKPQDGRQVVCHASAWDINSKDDVRIKMCTDITADDLMTVHHEQGHLYYDIMYKDQPYMFRDGAMDAFHEAVGDTIALSMTPAYLSKIGLGPTQSSSFSKKAELNDLMRLALDKLAFLPFAFVVDQWRFKVFDNLISPDQYTSEWWKMVESYQGLKSPEPRNDQVDFDPVSKYHVAANVPYVRYFLSYILQFQLHRGLCRSMGHTGDLHTCSIYESKVAGDQLMSMLKLGASKPWREALAIGTGGREWEIDPSALTQYFKPLIQYLHKENQGMFCKYQPTVYDDEQEHPSYKHPGHHHKHHGHHHKHHGHHHKHRGHHNGHRGHHNGHRGHHNGHHGHHNGHRGHHNGHHEHAHHD